MAQWVPGCSWARAKSLRCPALRSFWCTPSSAFSSSASWGPCAIDVQAAGWQGHRGAVAAVSDLRAVPAGAGARHPYRAGPRRAGTVAEIDSGR